MNDAGVSAWQHQSWRNPTFGQMDFSLPLLPINLAIRQDLEQEDVNGEGVCSANDVTDFLAW